MKFLAQTLSELFLAENLWSSNKKLICRPPPAPTEFNAKSTFEPLEIFGIIKISVRFCPKRSYPGFNMSRLKGETSPRTKNDHERMRLKKEKYPSVQRYKYEIKF